jgi:hypothetical protein
MVPAEVVMPHDARANVVPLTRARRDRRASSGDEPVAAPWLDAWPPHDDASVNADWDRLVALVMQAWCWRDPESIDELVRCLRTLRSVVHREWS